jgi:uncharacterized repeat protein (TIGR02543 family)
MLPAAVVGATWTCTATPASVCPPFGTGSINTSAVHLQSGGSATFVVSGTVAQNAVGTLSNTATVAVPAGVEDPAAANDSATDTSSIAPPPNGTLSLVRNGTGSGTVTSNDAQIDCGATCAHAYAGGSTPTLSATAAMGSVFTGWLGGCTGTVPCNVFIDGDVNVTATFAPASVGNRTLDADDSSSYDALTDGLLIIRFLFGLTGTPLTSNALGLNAQRNTPALVAGYLDDVRPRLDIDGNGVVDALTDGLMVLRWLFGLSGATLVQGAVGPGAIRTTAPQIELYLLLQQP